MNLFNKFPKHVQEPSSPKVAMMMCIQNEERFLDANLRYHRSLGISRAYVYLDRCDDASLQIAQSYPWVVPIILNDRLHTISPFYPDLFRVCADNALRMAREEGFDWLVSFDVDEFLFANNRSRIRKNDYDLTNIPLDKILRDGHLPSLLAKVSSKIEAVFVASWNVVPKQLSPSSPFWKHHFFQDRKPLPKFMCDPLTGQTLIWSGGVASRGKSIVRTNADIQCFGSHQWVRAQGYDYSTRPSNIPIPTAESGFLFHFYITDSRHWREKYQKLSRETIRWHAGQPVAFPKQCGKRASAVLTNEEIDIYLNEWIYSSQDELDKLVGEKLLRKADLVEKVLTGVNLHDLNDAPPNRQVVDTILSDFRVVEKRAIANKRIKAPLSTPQKRRSTRKTKSSGGLPAVSCVCVYQGQREPLEEAVFSFLQQDYQGEKELLILNDQPEQLLIFNHPEINIINLPKSFSGPDQRRNTAVTLSTHDLLFVWNDDGILLPHCISFSIERFGKWKGFFKSNLAFVLSDGALRLPRQNIFHTGSCFTRDAYNKIRGYVYEEKLHFYEAEFEAQFVRKNPKLVQYYDIALQDIYYIFRWQGAAVFTRKGEADLALTESGSITLDPHWEEDYQVLVQDFLAETSARD